MHTPNSPGSLSPQLCPLCGQANQCAVAAGADAQSCWCMQTRIAPEALARLPASERGKRCICAHCGSSTAGSPEEP